MLLLITTRTQTPVRNQCSCYTVRVRLPDIGTTGAAAIAEALKVNTSVTNLTFLRAYAAERPRQEAK